MPLRLLVFFLTLFSIFFLPKIPVVVLWDQHALAYLSAHRESWITGIMLGVTHLGSTWVFLVALLLPLILFLKKRRWATGIFYLLGVGLLKGSVGLWKYLVARPRPPEPLVDFNNFSMPSGHASNGVIIYGMLMIYLVAHLRSKAGKMAATIFCFTMILLTAFSRVYLGVHYPSDVLMGALYTVSGLWVLQGLREDIYDF